MKNDCPTQPFVFYVLIQEQKAVAEAEVRFSAKRLITLQAAFNCWKQSTVVFKERRQLKEMADLHRDAIIKKTYLNK